ncbi:hypothetical protein LTR65_006188 [Meristemomyces frigidus]
MVDRTAMETALHTDPAQEDGGATFFSLPQEVRDMIYIYWPKIAWIDVTQSFPQNNIIVDREHDKSVLQPNISRVSRRMRKECLDVFYGKNKFLLDLRGWKHDHYPKRWTPLMIFEHWFDAIGDESAGRLRSLSFMSHNFSAHVRMSNEAPQLSLKFRPGPSKPELAENVPLNYTFSLAAKRAEEGLRSVLDDIQARTQGQPLRVDDIKRICRVVDSIQPYLCKRSALGYQGAIMPSSDITQWSDTAAHLNKCDDCGYHRFTRGED